MKRNYNYSPKTSSENVSPISYSDLKKNTATSTVNRYFLYHHNQADSRTTLNVHTLICWYTSSTVHKYMDVSPFYLLLRGLPVLSHPTDGLWCNSSCSVCGRRRDKSKITIRSCCSTDRAFHEGALLCCMAAGCSPELL